MVDVAYTPIFTPHDWYWLVKETNRYWSSKVSSYVNDIGNNYFTTIDTENNLSQVLDSYNLSGPTPVVPAQVTAYQARAALIQAGLFDKVDAFIQTLPKNTTEYQAWEYANYFYRDSPFISSVATTLGLTSDQVDQLFIAASKVT